LAFESFAVAASAYHHSLQNFASISEAEDPLWKR
jgi:hypothetical protein